jgi:methylation protein EvaC
MLMMNCRICKEVLEFPISYGNMPIANGFLKKEDFSTEYKFEMKVSFCDNCKMFQLIDQPDPKMMFHENYAFFSSTSKSMEIHFEKMAKNYFLNFIPNKEEAFVVELGSNDGIMLQHFAKLGIKHLGVEPSSNVAEVAREKGVECISAFFGEDTAKEILSKHGYADIISAANVMCHIPDLESVGKGVACLLKISGIFVFEDPYLGDVIQKTSYDQIYDEHVYLFSVQSVQNAFSPYGLTVFHVEPQYTHGGSMRYYLCRDGQHEVRDSVKKQLGIEAILGLDTPDTYKFFEKNCEKNKNDLLGLVKELKSKGKRVVGYAATSKSTTILNYCGIGPDLIEYICDTTPLKQGKYSPGMHIPIKPYEDFKKDSPDYVILFAWNHAKEIFDKEKDFIQSGGKWIIFVPEVTVLSIEQVESQNVA